MPEPKPPKNAGPTQWVGPGDARYERSGLIHSVRLPERAGSNQPVPAIVMVHGWGGDESVMWIFKQAIPDGAAIITPRAPLKLDNEGGYVWYHHHNRQRLQPDPASLEEGIAALERFLSRLPGLYPIDPDQLVLVGFSQGAAVGNSLVIRQPDIVTGMASLASHVPQLPQETPPSKDLAGLPVFIAHGTDDETVPLSEARQARDIYTRLGANVTYGEYPVGHKMNAQAMRDLKAWLAKVIKPAL